ncbi:MAG: hypothetical protein LJF30_08460 [Acidobacteria bacterium]|nr:hypothetical protein [Acidobacteriota bacterium]
MGPGTASAQDPAVAAERPSHIWRDVEGQPLPFQSDAEILEFLRTAEVKERKRTDTGVAGAEKLLLEKDGTRAHACFRVVDIEKNNVTYGRFYFDFRDSYRHECAAYELARWLGLDFVPPTVLRRVDGKDGSVQIWLENALGSQGFEPPDVRAWTSQVWDKDLFDNLILNVDRNLGNVLRDEQYKLWLIDHTRAFQPERELPNPEALARVRRQIWDRLLETTKEDLKELLGDYLDGKQLTSLAKRREALIKHVRGLIAERGEDAVLY